MKISNRELGFAWVTVVVLLLAGSYWLAGPKVEQWQKTVKEMETVSRDMQIKRYLIDQRASWEQELVALRAELPQHEQNKEVTAELLKNLEQTARQHSLTLLRREPEAEEGMGDDLYEVAIHCTWEGDLGALVHFLYAIQMQGVILDIRQLTATPIQGGADKLKGSFTVDCAYTRHSAGVDTVKP